MRRSFSWKIVSFLLIISLMSTSFYGCTKSGEGIVPVSPDVESDEDPEVEIDTGLIADIITEQIRQAEEEAKEDSKKDEENENTDTDDINLGNQVIFDGDVYKFARNLLISEYELVYNVFHAEIKLGDGSIHEGIGFTDYSAYYEREDGLGGYFPAGFISFEDVIIPDSDIESGLEIYEIDSLDDEYGFVYAVIVDAFLEHCVVDSQYVKYGVNENGSFTCEYEEFSREICDEGLGALYSYDESRYLYDPDVGEYAPIYGKSLVSEIDYKELENEINRVLENQDELFMEIDVETQIAFAKDCVSSYLLSLQEETFLGCKTSELLEILKTLDPKECIRITPEGAMVMDVGSTLPTEATALTKWLVGAACIINVGGCIALTIWVPAGTVAWSALSASTIEIFMQVVVDNRNLENVQWSKVGVSAVTGALLAWACPAGASAVAGEVAKAGASQALAKLAGYGVLTLSNAIVSGATGAAYAAIDGKSEEEIWDAALMAAAIGGALTIVASAFSEGISAGINALRTAKPELGIFKATDKASAFISEHQVHLKNKKLEDFLIPKSIHEAVVEAKRSLETQKAAKDIMDDYLDDVLPDDVVPDNTTKLKPNRRYTRGTDTYYTDDTGKIIRINDDLLPDNTYKLNGYEYKTDSKGRIIEAKGTLKTKYDSGRTQRKDISDSKGVIGNGDELSTDSRGHLIGDQFDGGSGKENIVAQDSALNQGEYKNLEQSWAKAINEGKKVEVSIKPVYDNDSFRPTSFDIDYSIDGEQFFVSFRNGV